MKRYVLIAAAVVLGLWLRTALYTVDYAEFAYVTRFGAKVEVHDGVADVEAGLAGAVGVPAASVADGQFRSADLKAIDDRSERVRRRLLGEDVPGDNLRQRALAEYGIQVLDVRVRRFSYPEAVRASI